MVLLLDTVLDSHWQTFLHLEQEKKADQVKPSFLVFIDIMPYKKKRGHSREGLVMADTQAPSRVSLARM